MTCIAHKLTPGDCVIGHGTIDYITRHRAGVYVWYLNGETCMYDEQVSVPVLTACAPIARPKWLDYIRADGVSRYDKLGIGRNDHYISADDNTVCAGTIDVTTRGDLSFTVVWGE